jgi:hypothetical protein
MEYKCLVCGFDKLKNPIYDNNGNGTYEICVCCGFEYGCDDFPDKQISYKNWRETWIKNGCKWFSKSTPPPRDWNPKIQLQLHFNENSLLK